MPADTPFPMRVQRDGRDAVMWLGGLMAPAEMKLGDYWTDKLGTVRRARLAVWRNKDDSWPLRPYVMGKPAPCVTYVEEGLRKEPEPPPPSPESGWDDTWLAGVERFLVGDNLVVT